MTEGFWFRSNFLFSVFREVFITQSMADGATEQQKCLDLHCSRFPLRETNILLLGVILTRNFLSVILRNMFLWGMCVSKMFCCSSIKVRELESPLGVLPMAVLRSPDIISFTVDLPQQSSVKSDVTDASWCTVCSEWLWPTVAMCFMCWCT